MFTNNTISKRSQVGSTTQATWALRFSERRLVLQFGDWLCMNLALLISVYLQSQVGDLEVRMTSLVKWSTSLSLLWFAFATISDVYNLARASDAFRSMTLTGTAAAATIGIYFLIPYVSPSIPARRTYLFLLPILAVAFVMTWRLIYARFAWQPVFTRRLLIVGAGRSAQALMQVLNREEVTRSEYAHLGHEVVALIDDDATKLGKLVKGVQVRGTSSDLTQVAQQTQADEVVVAITKTSEIQDQLFRQLLLCQESGIPVTMMPEIYTELTGRIPTEHIGRNLTAVMPHEQPPTFRFYLAVRRLADIVLALFGCCLLVLVMPLIWLANRFTAPGDLFFKQERVGKAGSTFDVYKFRSMVMNAEKLTGAVWAQKDDPRITPVGNFLRKTRLDEIPQFWNVLKGDMSLVGPRPERPYFVEQLEDEFALYRLRHAVKPGMTGWAQVMYRYGASVEDAEMKLQYDLYYIKNRGPYLDLLILLRTIQVVLGMKGQ